MVASRRILRTLSGVLVCLFVLLLIASSLLLLNGYLNVETQQTKADLQRGLDAYNNQLADLSSKESDWGDWDDAWNFTCGTEPQFPQDNLLDSAFADLDINTILFINNGDPNIAGSGCPESGTPTILDPAKQIVLPYDGTTPSTPIPADLRAALAPGSPILNHHSASAADHLTFTQNGLISLKEGAFMYAAAPVVHSDGTGPLAGTIIFGRYIDKSETQTLAGLTHFVDSHGNPTISFTSVSDASAPRDVVSARDKLLAGSKEVISRLGANLIAGYRIIDDYRGKPGVVMRIEVPRPTYTTGLRSIAYFDIALIVIGLIFGLVTLLLLKFIVLDRIGSLAAATAAVAQSRDYTSRVPVQGKDELSRITESLDKVLDELQDSAQLRRELEQLRGLAAAQSPVPQESTPGVEPGSALSFQSPTAPPSPPPSAPPAEPKVNNWSKEQTP